MLMLLPRFTCTSHWLPAYRICRTFRLVCGPHVVLLCELAAGCFGSEDCVEVLHVCCRLFELTPMLKLLKLMANQQQHHCVEGRQKQTNPLTFDTERLLSRCQGMLPKHGVTLLQMLFDQRLS